MLSIRKKLNIRSNGHAIILLLIVQLLISGFWLSQGGFFIVRDSGFYLAMAKRASELPFFADCHDTFKPSFHILQNGPYYAYLLNLLQRLPGGFAPSYFVLTQLLHFAFVVSLFFLARLWNRSILTSFLIALIVLFEPLHQWDIMTIKPSFCTQQTIAISLVLAAYGWKKKQSRYFFYSAVVLGLGGIFRSFNILFAPIMLMLGLLAASSWKGRLANAAICISVIFVLTLPEKAFFAANPHLKPLTGKVQLGIAVSHRMQLYHYLQAWILPDTLEYYYSLAPRLRDVNLVNKYRGTSLRFFHSFLHERIYRYGDTLSVALERYSKGGLIALREHPALYIKSCIKVLLVNCGLPSLNESDPPPYRFQLRLWPRASNVRPVRMPVWGNDLLRVDSCSGPFEECGDRTRPELIRTDMIGSLESMPYPGYLSYSIGKAWDSVSLLKGTFAVLLLLVSLVLLLARRVWSVLLFSSSIIAVYAAIIVFRAMPGSAEIVMVLPWIAWTAGMAFSRGKHNRRETQETNDIGAASEIVEELNVK